MEEVQVLVSIILPVYNVEKYLIQCLQSISQQTYKNIEVILIIDGATDSSYQLARNYAENEKRFKVVYQENAGSGPARNNGLNHVKGEFVVFIDPDDWIADDYIEALLIGYKKTNADMVLSGKWDCFCDIRGTILHKEKDVIISYATTNQLEVRKQYLNLSSKNLVNAPTRILYKTSIIKENNVEFPDLRRSQDIVFNYRYYNCIKSLCVLDYYGYMYRIERSSYALRLKPDYYKTIIHLFKDIENLHKYWNLPFDRVTASNIYGNVINVYIESMILHGINLYSILRIVDLLNIVRWSSPRGVYRKLMRFLIIHKLRRSIMLTIKIKRYVKKSN